MIYKNYMEFADAQDKSDPLKDFREKFYIPIINDRESIYFNGNSLGLQPKTAQDYVLTELEDWANYGVEGHVHARHPWVSYHEMFPKKLAAILGAQQEEIVVMNQLTVNLHLLLATFYRPTKERYKIICEEKAFPSDLYALKSRIQLSGYDVNDALVIVKTNEEGTIPDEVIIEKIKECGSQLALVMIGGVNYYSGQLFNMAAITEAAHEAGAVCGFDLAHAVGNVSLDLHDWNVDFACWCTYKYLNSGPGGVGGAFVHSRYAGDTSLLRMEGWWGTNKEKRFLMEDTFEAIPTAEGWQLSNVPILSMAAHNSSLDIFIEAGFANIIEKGKKLTGYLWFILDEISKNSSDPSFSIITPREPSRHGCQVSLLMHQNGRKVFDGLKKAGILADWREPDVIRIAPVPLYNTFKEVFLFGQAFAQLTADLKS